MLAGPRVVTRVCPRVRRRVLASPAMRSERGQATVEWVGLVLLVALALGFVITRAREVGSPEDRRGLGDLVAERIASAGDAAPAYGGAAPGSHPPPFREPAGRAPPTRSEAVAAPPLVPLGGRELIRSGARRAVALNGLACYLRKSTAEEDTNRVGDDIGDAVNCLNPVSGWTGELGGTDD